MRNYSYKLQLTTTMWSCVHQKKAEQENLSLLIRSNECFGLELDSAVWVSWLACEAMWVASCGRMEEPDVWSSGEEQRSPPRELSWWMGRRPFNFTSRGRFYKVLMSFIYKFYILIHVTQIRLLIVVGLRFRVRKLMLWEKKVFSKLSWQCLSFPKCILINIAFLFI